MLAQPTEFPHAGSRGFLAGTADPVTIIRRNADGSALVRVDPRPNGLRIRDASGNRTVAAEDLCATEREAFDAPPASSSAAVGREKTTTTRRRGKGSK